MHDDGTMARLPELIKVAEKFHLKIISIKDIIEYRLQNESLIKKELVVDMPPIGDILNCMHTAN
jgi:3,4-dihydroxy 2-butanone 4-phosphate synthase/GTP cyclohydrolase II